MWMACRRQTTRARAAVARRSKRSGATSSQPVRIPSSATDASISSPHEAGSPGRRRLSQRPPVGLRPRALAEVRPSLRPAVRVRTPASRGRHRPWADPSIEYLRGDSYRIVPDVAIASRGPVASVALFTTRPLPDVRSIVMDTSSRTSVALVRVLWPRLSKIDPAIEAQAPDLNAMLDRADAALIIGDKALVWDPETVRRKPDSMIQKIDLGEAW